MLIIKLYRLIYIMLVMITVITSCILPGYSDLKRGLKRKSEGCSDEVCKVNQFSLNTINPVEDLSVKVSTVNKENNNLLYDHIVEEYINVEAMSDVTPWESVTYRDINNNNNEKDKNKDRIIAELVAEMIRDEKRFIPNNSQSYNDIPNHIEDEEIDSLNSQAKIIDENPSVVLISEQNLIPQLFGNDFVYEYSNSLFLFLFLHFPSPSFTADSIRVRFGSGFLSFLSIDQSVRVLAVLLSSELELTNTERCELVELIFGCFDFSLEMNFNNDQIVSIVEALLSSNVPYCFEQVFLTWKMWKVFTTEEQERMLKSVIINKMDKARIKYDRETLMMLYLFVLNRDEANANSCEVFKVRILEMYGEPQVLNNDESLLTFSEYIERILLVANTLDTSLLELPNVLKSFDDIILTEFKKFTRERICAVKGFLNSIYFGKKYKIHICYALTKFTPEKAQDSSESVIDVFSKVYFTPEYIKRIFNKWGRLSKIDLLLANQCELNEFRNAYNAMRQIVQSEGYGHIEFLRLFRTICITNFFDRIFTLILFSSTKEDILRDVSKTPAWAEYIKTRRTSHHKFAYIENIFMYNVDSSLKLSKSTCPYKYVIGIDKSPLNPLNTDKGMYREYYLYQQLLFHPKSAFFNCSIISYVLGLDKIGKFAYKERRIQIARDLIFSEYYYKLAVKLMCALSESNGDLRKFGMCLENECRRYENETTIETERNAFKNC
ncbi:hypothetical protein PAEPH01_2458 [Pancytospora epiphaga]|nr:hypothetical protein PAEPH01_2458 [Pancytospora epiphaga]